MTADTVTATTWPTASALRAADNESVGPVPGGRGQPELFESIGESINIFEAAINQHASAIDSAAASLSGTVSTVTALAAPNYLVGTSTGTLSGEIVVGTSPGGELAGGGSTWAAPTVSTVHTGTSHAATRAAAEATAAAALLGHTSLGTGAHAASAVSVLDVAGILLSANVEAALAELRQGVINRRIVDVREIGVLSSNVGSVNAFIFNSVANAAPYAGHTVDWIFTEDSYDTTGFQINVSKHRIIGKAKGGVNWNFVNPSGGSCLTLVGTAIGGFAGRIQDVFVEGINFNNIGTAAPEASTAIKIRAATHCAFSRCYVYGFRAHGGGLDCSNFADSIFSEVDWQFCGSIDDSDKAIVKLHNDDDNAVWNNDSIIFYKCNFEDVGDRILDAQLGNGAGSGLLCDKITFLATKFESSGAKTYNMGGSAGNGAVFYMNNCLSMHWIMCDFTLQGMRISHSVIPTVFKLDNTCDVHITSSVFHIGAGSSPQCFTNFILGNAANQLVSLTDVWVDSGNSGAFPDLVLAATNGPRLAQTNVGFTPTQGGSKVATNWFTAADWKGIHAGAPSAGGVIA